MTTISDKILKTIKETQVKPEPKWKFLVRNWLTWITFAASLLVGALSFAVMLDIIVRHDWDIYFYLHKTLFQYVLLSLPYLWIMLLVLFFLVAYYDFIHIRGWYRHRVYLVVIASIFLSFGCGLVFFFAGFGKIVDRTLAKRVPFYGMMRVDKQALWNHPAEGLLGGEIVEVRQPDEFVLQDSLGRQWEVQDVDPVLNGKNIDQGENIEIIGRMEAAGKFIAKRIRQADNEKEDEFIAKKTRIRRAEICTQKKNCNVEFRGADKDSSFDER